MLEIVLLSWTISELIGNVSGPWGEIRQFTLVPLKAERILKRHAPLAQCRVLCSEKVFTLVLPLSI